MSSSIEAPEMKFSPGDRIRGVDHLISAGRLYHVVGCLNDGTTDVVVIRTWFRSRKRWSVSVVEMWLLENGFKIGMYWRDGTEKPDS